MRIAKTVIGCIMTLQKLLLLSILKKGYTNICQTTHIYLILKCLNYLSRCLSAVRNKTFYSDFTSITKLMWIIISRDFIHTLYTDFVALANAEHWYSPYISMPHTHYNNNFWLIIRLLLWDPKDRLNTVVWWLPILEIKYSWNTNEQDMTCFTTNI